MQKSLALRLSLIALGGLVFIYCLNSYFNTNTTTTNIDHSTITTENRITSLSPNHENQKHTSLSPAMTLLENNPQTHNIPAVEQKYLSLLTNLDIDKSTQVALMIILEKREQELSKAFYDAKSNDAEIQENLRLREIAITKIDQEAIVLLGTEEGKKYQLLKDSNYQQALLKDFYSLANMQNLSKKQNRQLLLNKMTLEQQVNDSIKASTSTIINASSINKPFLIDQLYQEIENHYRTFITQSSQLMNAEQLALFDDLEKNQLNENWKNQEAQMRED